MLRNIICDHGDHILGKRKFKTGSLELKSKSKWCENERIVDVLKISKLRVRFFLKNRSNWINPSRKWQCKREKAKTDVRRLPSLEPALCFTAQCHLLYLASLPARNFRACEAAYQAAPSWCVGCLLSNSGCCLWLVLKIGKYSKSRVMNHRIGPKGKKENDSGRLVAQLSRKHLAKLLWNILTVILDQSSWEQPSSFWQFQKHRVDCAVAIPRAPSTVHVASLKKKKESSC